MIRIAVYSDQPLLAKGMETSISADPALHLTESFSDLRALRLHLPAAQPDLLLLDWTPEITFAVLHELQSLAADCKLILWTSLINAEFAFQALTVGIRGILRKTLPVETHLQCLHRVHAGELWFEKSITDSFQASRRVLLSRRESELVTLLSRGYKNKEISAELGICEGTVKVYLSRLFQKSGAKDRFELAVQGMQNLRVAGALGDGEARLRTLVIDPVCHN